MSNSKHTPGHWVSLNNFAEGPFFIHKKLETGEVIAEVKTAANARLIAAAPELLEALERLVNEAVNRCLKETENASYLMAQNAVAKARGEK